MNVEENSVNNFNGMTFQNFGDKILIIFNNQDEMLKDLNIYNILGEKINYGSSVSENNSIRISNENLTSGLYIIKVTTNYQNAVFKIMVVK